MGCQAARWEEAARQAHLWVVEGSAEAHLVEGARLALWREAVGCQAAPWEEVARQAHH